MMFAQNQGAMPRTREMQETINHLVLGITMWISVTVTCVTTLLTVNQPWALLALIIPFIYTMFPQIQKSIANAREHAINKMREGRKKNVCCDDFGDLPLMQYKNGKTDEDSYEFVEGKKGKKSKKSKDLEKRDFSDSEVIEVLESALESVEVNSDEERVS